MLISKETTTNTFQIAAHRKALRRWPRLPLRIRPFTCWIYTAHLKGFKLILQSLLHTRLLAKVRWLNIHLKQMVKNRNQIWFKNNTHILGESLITRQHLELVKTTLIGSRSLAHLTGILCTSTMASITSRCPVNQAKWIPTCKTLVSLTTSQQLQQ